jgi:DNA-binding beta-propeller fold protein YncE
VNRREFLLAATAVVAAPRAALAATPSTFVLVTADLEARVLAIDPESGAVRRAIRTLEYPRSIEAASGFAVVAHPERGAVSILDARSLRVAHVLRGFGEPRYTAAHPDGRHAFVTDAARGELVTLDLVRGRVAARVRVGPLARHVTIDPGGTRIWVALGSKAEEVAVVDVRRRVRPRLLERFRPPFLAHDVACAPDGRHLWVSSGDRFELAVYDLRSGRLLRRPSGDWPPQHVSFAPERAYVTSGWSGTLRLHRADGRPLREVPVPVGSYNVQQALGRVVTPSLRDGTVTILDDAGRVLHSRSVAKSSHDACLV